MAESNAFGRRLLLESAASDANTNFKESTDSAKGLNQEMSNAILSIKSLVNESKNFQQTKGYIDELTKSISVLMNSMHGTEFSGFFDNLGSQIVDVEQQIKSFAREMSTAFKANGELKDNVNLDKVIADFAQLTQKTKELQGEMEKLEQIKSSADKSGVSKEVIDSFDDASKAVNRLMNEFKAIADVNPSEAISKHSDGFKSLRDQVSETADVLKTKGKDIRESTMSALSAGADADKGTIAILNQMSQAMEQLGTISGSNNKVVTNMYSELQKLGTGVDTKGVTQGLEAYSHAMKELEKAKADLNKVLSDNHLSKDAAQVHDALSKVMAIQEELVKTGKKVSDEYKEGGVGRLGLENYKEFNDEIGKIIKNYDELSRAAKNAGIEIDNAIDDDDYAGFAQGGRNSRNGKGKRSGFGNFAAAVGNVGEGIIDGAETMFSKGLGASQWWLRTAGLGGLTSMSGLIGQMVGQGNEYGRLWARSSVADQGNGYNGSDVFQNMFSRGTDMHTQTNGMINWKDLENERIGLNQTVMGQYGSKSAGQDAYEMGELAESSLIYQKSLNVNKGTMDSAINQFYKEYKMNLTETEYLLSKVANQSMALNIPMEEHLKNVMGLSENYKSFGLSVDDAGSALNNLMNPNGAFGMNQKDAMNTAQNIGQGMGSLSDGWAAYGGMRYGGAENPFEAIWNYKDKWNADGSVNDNWTENTVGMITNLSGQFKNMAGGNEDLQKYLQYGFYKNQMGMDEKTAVQLADTNDPEVIKKILQESQADSTKSDAEKNAESQKTTEELLQNIATASENLSGVDKTLAALEVELTKVAAEAKPMIDAMTDFREPIRALGGMLTDSIGAMETAMNEAAKWEDAAKSLETAMYVLAGAMAVLTAAGVVSKGIKGTVGAAKWGKKKFDDSKVGKTYSNWKERKNRPGKGKDSDSDSDVDNKNKSDSNTDGNKGSKNRSQRRKEAREEMKRIAEEKKTPKRLNAPDTPKLPAPVGEAAVKGGAKSTAKGLAKGAAKIGGKALGLGSMLIDPIMYFGSAMKGGMTKSKAAEAAKDTATSWGTVGAGAAIGAGIGSIIPGAGTAVGAGIGASVGGLVDIVTHDKVKKAGEKVGSDIKEGTKKAGDAIGKAGATVGGFLSKSAKSVASLFSKSGKDAEEGSKKAKPDFDSAGKNSKKNLEDVGKEAEKGSKNAKKDLDKAGSGSKKDLESVGKNVGKGYDKASNDIKDSKSKFDKMLDGLFSGKGSGKSRALVGAGAAVAGVGIGAGIGSLIDKIFGGGSNGKGEDDAKQYRKETEKLQKEISKNTDGREKTGDKHYKEASTQGKTLDKQLDQQKDRNKTGDKHFDEARGQSKTLDKSLDEQKGSHVNLKDYVKEKFPKFHEMMEKAEKDAKELTKKSLEELGNLGAILTTGFADLGMAIAAISTGGGDAGGAGLTEGKNNEEKVWNFFAEKGFSKSGISGIMGNLMQESGMNPNAVNKSSGAFGIGQWLGGRLTNLKNYAKEKGKPVNDLQLQLDFLWKELNGGDATTKSILNKNGGLDALKNSSSSYNAMVLFEKAFERSGGSAMSKRAKYAEDILSKYGSIDAGGIGLAGGSGDVADWYLNNYNITSRFGAKESFRASAHNGLDFDGKMGDLIAALAGGTVVRAETGHKKGEKNSYGNVVEVKHKDGTTSLYSHLKDVAVQVGQTIAAGAKIGTMGNTGSVFSTTGDGSHLHLGLKDASGKFIDPEKWVRSLANSNGSYGGGDAGGVGLADAMNSGVGFGGFMSGGEAYGNSGSKPFFTSVGSKSIYGLGSDATWSARGLYESSLAYTKDGYNFTQANRDGSEDGRYQINVYADPGRDSEYYKQLASVVEKAVKDAEKTFAEQWNRIRNLNS